MLLNITIDNLEDSAVESSTWFVCTLTSNCSCEHLVITATPHPLFVTAYNKYMYIRHLYTTGKRKATYLTLYPFFPIAADVLVKKTSMTQWMF